MRWPWSKREDPQVPAAREREPCILDDSELYITAPTTSFVKNGMPLIIVEETHVDIIQHGLVPVRTYSFRDPTRADIRNLPVGVYTVEHYMELDEFVHEKTEPERDTGTVSG